MTCLVITRVKVRSGSLDALAARFDATNRDLVAGHDDWLGAWFTVDREADEVTVVAKWANPDSYQALRDSEAFQAVMAGFATDFLGPPTVAVTEIVVEM